VEVVEGFEGEGLGGGGSRWRLSLGSGAGVLGFLAGRAERAGRAESAERAEKAESAERAEKAERVERVERRWWGASGAGRGEGRGCAAGVDKQSLSKSGGGERGDLRRLGGCEALLGFRISENRVTL